MELTNKHGLPDELYSGIKQWFFSKRNPNPPHFRVTELIRPIQQVILERRHNEEMDVDVMDMLNAFEGSATHEFLQKFGDADALQEELIEIELAGLKLRGVPDYYKNKKIVDWKKCSVWAYVHGSNIDEWTEQLNIYAFMYQSLGFPVESLEIVALFKDWSPTQALASSDYPRTRSVVVPLLLLPQAKVKALIESRLKLYAKNLRETADEDLPECTHEEMWADPEKHAVMKEGRKSAVKLHDTAEAAEKHAAELGAKHYVQHRPGKRKRCEAYCAAAQFCVQHQNYLRERGEVDAEVG